MSEGRLFDGVLARGRVRDAVGDTAWLQAMLDVEAALARASATAGLISEADAETIGAACGAAHYDAAEIGAQAASSGNPAAPLVKALTKRVEGSAAGHVHRGATSQDVVDSAAMLVAHRALRPLLDDLEGAADAAARLARERCR
jgi:3-carboxy-cis,cis-muconate cycloisomerase